MTTSKVTTKKDKTISQKWKGIYSQHTEYV